MASTTSGNSPPGLGTPSHVLAATPMTDESDEVTRVWREQLLEISTMKHEDFKNHTLPIARVKKIMKMDEDIRANQMVSADAPILFAKACEMFVVDLTSRAWRSTEQGKRRILQRSDVAHAVVENDWFDFLVDVIPEELYNRAIKQRKHARKGANVRHTHATQMQLARMQAGEPSLSGPFNNVGPLPQYYNPALHAHQYYNLYNSTIPSQMSAPLQDTASRDASGQPTNAAVYAQPVQYSPSANDSYALQYYRMPPSLMPYQTNSRNPDETEGWNGPWQNAR